MDYGTSFTDSSYEWRLPLAFQAVFAICLILQVVGLPKVLVGWSNMTDTMKPALW